MTLPFFEVVVVLVGAWPLTNGIGIVVVGMVVVVPKWRWGRQMCESTTPPHWGLTNHHISMLIPVGFRALIIFIFAL